MGKQRIVMGVSDGEELEVVAGDGDFENETFRLVRVADTVNASMIPIYIADLMVERYGEDVEYAVELALCGYDEMYWFVTILLE